MANINIFDSYYMAGMVQELPPVSSFFRDRYFATNDATDIFATDKVLVEYEDGDRKLAPFVVPRAGDVPIKRSGYEVHEFVPPYIAPSRLLTLDDLNKRGFGEALYAGKTPAERALALQMKDLTDLDRRITRREEWMASQTMINNGCTMVQYADNDTTGESIDVYFYDTSGSNPAIYTVGDEWDDTNGNFWGDVEAMCANLAERGLPAADLVVGSAVGQYITNRTDVQNLLNNRRVEIGALAPKIVHPGVTWLGKINFSGFDLEIFVVRETYDNNGSSTRYFPNKSAMVTAPACGHMMYGAVSQIEDDDNYHTFAMRRVPKYVVNKEKDIRKLRLASRPLAAPKNKAPWIYAANVVL